MNDPADADGPPAPAADGGPAAEEPDAGAIRAERDGLLAALRRPEARPGRGAAADWCAVGKLSLALFEHEENEADLRRAEHALVRAAERSRDPVTRGEALVLLGRVHALRHDREEAPALADLAERELTDGLAALEGLPGGEEQRRYGRLQLAFVAAARHENATDPGEREALAAEATRRLTDALADRADEPLAADLRLALADLAHERGCRTDDPEDFRAAAAHVRAALAEVPPGPDRAALRFGLAKALMGQGVAAADAGLFAEARDGFDRALEEAPAEGAWWVHEARMRRAFVRGVLGQERRDGRQVALAAAEATQLLDEPGALEGIPPVFLHRFAEFLYERASAREDDPGRERALAMMRHAVAAWDPARDGPAAWRASLMLAALQQRRYLGDRAPARLRDVIDGSARVLAEEDAGADFRDIARMLLAWARHEEGDAAPEGEPAPSREEVLDSLRRLMQGVVQGRDFIDFGPGEDAGALIGELAHDSLRTPESLLAHYREWEERGPDAEDRAASARSILTFLPVLDPHGTHVTREQKRALIDAAVGDPGADPATRARAHVVAALVLLNDGLDASGRTLDELRHHVEQARELGASDPVFAQVEAQVTALLGQVRGGRDEREAGQRLVDRLAGEETFTSYQRLLAQADSATAAAIAAAQARDVAGLDRALARLADVAERLSPEDPVRAQVWVRLDGLALFRDDLARTGGLPPAPPPRRRPTDAELRRTAARLPRRERGHLVGTLAHLRCTEALRAQDPRALAAACGLLREAMDLQEPESADWHSSASTLGMSLCALAEVEPRPSRRAELVAESVERLEVCRRLAGGPAHQMWADLSVSLGRAYRLRDASGDRAAARRAGLEGLRGHAWSTLLQAGTAHAAEAAREATSGALEVAAWCLADGAFDEAVRALDACRGLVLHATVTAAGVPRSLEAVGRPDLARAWREAGGEETASHVPGTAPARGPGSDLRRRVFEALTASDAGRRRGAALLDPPEPAEIAAALRATGADALAYLVPAHGGAGGAAVIVTAGGRVGTLPLPRLAEDAAPLRAYAPAGREARDMGPASAGPAGAAPPPAPRQQLDRLCAWAWYAAMEPLISALGPEDDDAEPGNGPAPLKLVLVPMGAFAVVPWHAAWGPAGGGARLHAVERAEISYAASARLLCEAAARGPAAPGDAALIVGDPTGDLRHAGEEADAVQRVLYPRGRFLGRRATAAADGEGTPAEVLSWLRSLPDGTGTLHLACHGTVAEHGLRTARLWLAGGDLAAEELTEAHGEGAAGPGLVVLAACRSHVSGRGFNEAYSLSTAFLVAGARSVIGSLWPVPDDATSVLMFMTHWFLRREKAAPGEALRRAQLWMLDPGRAAPEGMPAALAERAARVAPHDLAAWAGFTHLGR
ncbi:CHAT domain-containing protein [Streptomyces sp. DSM 44917]|uniref:CHAT domain-containing protein n=1 Tax=Streptomyces boetiae TaxID=3075541 RepID=A0ABU2LCQ4_9ACTN|nr:CHAT domain-containing protein [Streptomyces sp. DSM 44917]MDT0309251.1 CHAT domain-containing protein [Streptomyces sp. DSM 44917]